MPIRRVAIVDPQPVQLAGPGEGLTYVANLILSLCVEAEAFGFEPVVRTVRRGRSLPHAGVDDIVIASIYMDREELPDAETLVDVLDMPVLVVGSGRRWAVWVDSREGIRLAFRHLLDLGHRRIAHFEGPRSLFSARERADEFRRLCAAHPEVDGRTVPMSHEDLVQELRRDDRPTALIAFSDGLAVWAMRAARDLGLRVPDDLSVTGFDNDVQSVTCDPPLTTVTNSTDETARLAFRLLADWLDSGIPPEEPGVVPVELVVRDSTRRIPV